MAKTNAKPQSNVIYTFIPESGIKTRQTFEGYDEKGRVAMRNVENGFIKKISTARFSYMHARFLVSEIPIETNDVQDNMPGIIAELRKVGAVKSEKIRKHTGRSARALAGELETVFIKENGADLQKVKMLTCAYNEALKIARA